MNKDDVEVLLIRVATATLKMAIYMCVSVMLIFSGLLILLSVREIDLYAVLVAVLFLVGVALITWRDYNAEN